MPLFVNNDNDIQWKQLRKTIYPNVFIEDADPVLTLLKQNTLTITSIVDTLITMSGDHGFVVGDEVTVIRVLGTELVNGKHEVATVPEANQLTLVDIDATGLTYIVGTGNIYKIVDPDNAKEIPMQWDEDSSSYVGTLPAEVDLIPKHKYIMLIEEPTLSISVEHVVTAVIRTN